MSKPRLITGNERVDELLNRVHDTSLGKSVSASEWQEIEEFLLENLMTDELIMREYELGKSTGCELGKREAAETVMKKAADLFLAGKDSLAIEYRNLASSINLK